MANGHTTKDHTYIQYGKYNHPTSKDTSQWSSGQNTTGNNMTISPKSSKENADFLNLTADNASTPFADNLDDILSKLSANKVDGSLETTDDENHTGYTNEDWYSGASAEVKDFLDKILNNATESSEDEENDEDNKTSEGSSSSDVVPEGAKEDDYEYTYLNTSVDVKNMKDYNPWVAMNSNLIINEIMLPMEYSLRDILQNQYVYEGIKNLEAAILEGSTDGDLGNNPEKLKALKDAAAGLDGQGTHGILDESGNLAPIYATRLYYATSENGDALIPARVGDLFDITQTDNKVFYIKYRSYDKAATEKLGENAAPQYAIEKKAVYKFDFYTYEYMALASIIDPDLAVYLSGYSQQAVSMDMYGNILLASGETSAENQGKVVIPALANSYVMQNLDPTLEKNAAATLFNRIFVAGYDFNTASELKTKSQSTTGGDGQGVEEKVSFVDFQKIMATNLLGKDKFFMSQTDCTFKVKDGIKASDQADKNAWELFLSNIQNVYGNMVDMHVELRSPLEKGTNDTVSDEEVATYKEEHPDLYNNYYLGGLATFCYSPSKSKSTRWKYSARLNNATSSFDKTSSAMLGFVWANGDNNETFHYLVGDWTKYTGSVDKTSLFGQAVDADGNAISDPPFLQQSMVTLEHHFHVGTVYQDTEGPDESIDIYTINTSDFLNRIDSLAKDSVNKDSWLQSITPTEFAAWTTVLTRFATKATEVEDAGQDDTSHTVKNAVFSAYCSYPSDKSIENLNKDENLVGEDKNNFAYNISQSSFYGTFIRSWDLDGFVKLDAGGLVYLNEDDQTTLETNEERSSNILFYMNKILGDLGSSLTDITAMRLSHEYRSIESASILNLIFQIDNFLEDKFVLKILQFYFFLVIFLNTLWFITRIINLFSETSDALTTYVVDMLKSIALSTVPILLLMLFTYVANWSTSLIFTKTFMYWTGIKLDSLNLANVNEDSFTTDLEHFLQITAPQTYDDDYVRLPYIGGEAVIKDGKYEISKISLGDLRNKIDRGIISKTELEQYAQDNTEMTVAELKNRIMVNNDFYDDNLFYYFYDVMRWHYYNYYTEKGYGGQYHLNDSFEAIQEAIENGELPDDMSSVGSFCDTKHGMSATSGTVLAMINDPIFLFGQSYLNNKENLGDFADAKDTYLKNLQVQDICEFTDLFSGQKTVFGAGTEAGFADIARYNTIKGATWYKILMNSTVATDTMYTTASYGLNPFDVENYGTKINNQVYFGTTSYPRTVFGAEQLYPESYNPSLVEKKLNDINKQVAKDLLQLNDYKGFTDETIMQLAALTMTIDFNRMMSTEFKPEQTLQPTSVYGKSYGMDTIFTSIYVENSSALKNVIGQDMIMYTKNKGGFFAQLLLIVTLIVGQLAGLLKYILILFILGLSMFTFLLVYNFAKDFYSEAWLGLATLYLLQLGIHVLFLIALAALCIPKTAEISTSIFQGYSGTIKLFVLLVLFLLQIFAFIKIGIFAAKNYYTLGGDIVKAKFNEMKSAFGNLIAGKGFHATTTNAEYASENTTVKSDSTDTEISEADINAGTNQIDDVNQARMEGETAVENMQMEDARAEAEGKASGEAGIKSEQTEVNLNAEKAQIEQGLERSYVAGLSASELAAATNNDERLDLEYDKSLWSDSDNMYMTREELEKDLLNAPLVSAFDKYQATSTPEGFLKSEGLDNIPNEVKGSDNEYFKYLQTLSPEDKYKANMQRAAYILQEKGQLKNIQADAIAKYGKDTYGAAQVASKQYRDSLQKAYRSVVNTMSNATAREAFEAQYGEGGIGTKEGLGFRISKETIDAYNNDADTQADTFKEKHSSSSQTEDKTPKLKNADESVNATMDKYSSDSESYFSAFDDEDNSTFSSSSSSSSSSPLSSSYDDYDDYDDDEEDWDNALQQKDSVHQDTLNVPKESATREVKKSERLERVGDSYGRESLFGSDSGDSVLDYFNTKGGKLNGYNEVKLSMTDGRVSDDATGYQCYTKSDPNSTGEMEIYPSAITKSPQMSRYYKTLFDFNGSGKTVKEVKPCKVIRNAFGTYEVVEKGSVTFE